MRLREPFCRRGAGGPAFRRPGQKRTPPEGKARLRPEPAVVRAPLPGTPAFFDRSSVSIMTRVSPRDGRQRLRESGLDHGRAKMPVSNENTAANDFFVERRIRIGLDALSPEERQIIEDATRTKARFLALIADPKNVEKLRPTAPYYSLKITPELRLIYTREGDRIDVLDVRNQAWLDRYGSKSSERAQAQSAPKNKKPVSSKRARRPS
jgi:Txe/YoeB family toxin of Txe-Axe toxin-antitoxin module